MRLIFFNPYQRPGLKLLHVAPFHTFLGGRDARRFEIYNRYSLLDLDDIVRKSTKYKHRFASDG